MVDLRKDWLTNTVGKARAEAAIAVEELRSGHAQFQDDVPLEIKLMMNEVVQSEYVNTLNCQTPMKVKFEVRADPDD